MQAYIRIFWTLVLALQFYNPLFCCDEILFDQKFHNEKMFMNAIFMYQSIFVFNIYLQFVLRYDWIINILMRYTQIFCLSICGLYWILICYTAVVSIYFQWFLNFFFVKLPFLVIFRYKLHFYFLILFKLYSI